MYIEYVIRSCDLSVEHGILPFYLWISRVKLIIESKINISKKVLTFVLDEHII